MATTTTLETNLSFFFFFFFMRVSQLSRFNVNMFCTTGFCVEDKGRAIILKQTCKNLASAVQIIRNFQNWVIPHCCFVEDGKISYRYWKYACEAVFLVKSFVSGITDKIWQKHDLAMSVLRKDYQMVLAISPSVSIIKRQIQHIKTIGYSAVEISELAVSENHLPHECGALALLDKN